MSRPISPVHRGDPLDVGGVLRGVDRRVNRLAVEVPLLQWNAQHRQREYRGHDVGQVVDEVDAAGLDLLVEAGAGDVVDERFPTLDRGRRQVGIEHGAVGAVFGLIHLQDAAAHHADAAGGRNRNPFVAAAFVVDVVIVGDRGAAGELENLVAARRDPVPAVGLGPRHRALGVHLLGDLLELRAVLRGVPVEVVLRSSYDRRRSRHRRHSRCCLPLAFRP